MPIWGDCVPDICKDYGFGALCPIHAPTEVKLGVRIGPVVYLSMLNFTSVQRVTPAERKSTNRSLNKLNIRGQSCR